jgi:hypothetical protein
MLAAMGRGDALVDAELRRLMLWSSADQLRLEHS